MLKNKIRLAAIAFAVIAGGLWYAFRPERLFINRTVNEGFPAASADSNQPVALASGQFHNGVHPTKGTATVLKTAGGKRTLRLTNFETSNGPDVHVYLIAANDATDNDTVTKAGFIELGSLKGNIGDQNYDLPTDADLNKYKAVTIWCKRFSVNFGTAPLNATTATGAQPVKVASGNFHDVTHSGKGEAAVFTLGDGERMLRFTDFETSNGPDVVVYLIAASDANDSDSVKNAAPILLGSLKGNKGDQNYEVPSDVDLNKYKAVTIWCRRFNVNFATAPLSQQS